MKKKYGHLDEGWGGSEDQILTGFFPNTVSAKGHSDSTMAASDKTVQSWDRTQNTHLTSLRHYQSGYFDRCGGGWVVGRCVVGFS